MVLKSLRMVVSWQCCRKRFRPRKKTKRAFKLYILRSLGRPRLIALVTREAATGTESQDFVTHSHKTAHHALSLLFPSLSDCSLFVVCFKTRKNTSPSCKYIVFLPLVCLLLLLLFNLFYWLFFLKCLCCSYHTDFSRKGRKKTEIWTMSKQLWHTSLLSIIMMMMVALVMRRMLAKMRMASMFLALLPRAPRCWGMEVGLRRG